MIMGLALLSGCATGARPVLTPVEAVHPELEPVYSALAGRETLIFEDSAIGIEAARRAGMKAVAVCTSHSAVQLAGDHVIATIRHYEELIDNQFLETLHARTT